MVGKKASARAAVAAAALALSGCSGTIAGNAGACVGGQAQPPVSLSLGAAPAAPTGTITLSAPAGTALALCVW